MLIIAGGFVVLAFLALLAIGVGIGLGYLPDACVVDGDGVNDRMRAKIDQVVPLGDEQILWFYSTGLLDVSVDGNLLTDRRVISWSDEPGEESFIDEVALSNIAGIRVRFDDSFLNDTELAVFTFDMEEGGEAYWAPTYLVLASDQDGDHSFIEGLVEAANDAGAAIEFIEVDGDLTDGEVERIDGAERATFADVMDEPSSSPESSK